MDIEEVLQEVVEEILIKLQVEYNSVKIEEDEKDNFTINIKSDNPSLLIGYHGENMQALQHVVKVLAWKRCANEQFNILLDIDDYRKRQEENVLNLAQRKIERLRQSGRPQALPPMSPYFRRKVHMHCMEPGNEDLETISKGEGDHRHIVIKLK